MDKLQQLYQKRDTFLEFGEDVPDVLVKQIEQAEQEILKRNLVPVIEKKALKQIPALGLDKDVLVAYEYRGNKLVSIGISTNVDKIHEFDIKENVDDNTVKGRLSEDVDAKYIIKDGGLWNKSEEIVAEADSESRQISKKMPAKGLCVCLPNGSIIQGRDGSDTMTKAIKYAGLMNVAQLNIMLDKLNLVSREKNPNRASQQHYAGMGFYVNTHCNTITKKRLLDRISSLLHLGWRVEIIDK